MPRKKTFKRGAYKSKLEVRFAKELKKKKGVKISYETANIPYTVRRTYVPDFVCVKPSGETFYIEVKGYFRAEDRTKLRAVGAEVPRPDVRLLFAADNKVSSKSRMRYSDWCEKYGFPYAVGEIPEEWFA